MADFNSWADATFGADTTPPSPPTGLAAVAGNAQVTLDWADNTEPDLAGYSVFRSTINGGPYSDISGSLVTTSSYTDNTVANGATYYYVVTAADTSANESTYSNQASATPTAPVTVAFFPTADAYVNQASAGTNYGTATTLNVMDATNDRHTYLKFTTSGLSGTVTNAKLRLKCSATQSGSTMAYQVSNTSWTETGLTWTNKPAMGEQEDSKSNVVAGQWIELDVTGYITGNATYSIGVQTTSGSLVQYHSKERTGTAEDPVLEVTFQ